MKRITYITLAICAAWVFHNYVELARTQMITAATQGIQPKEYAAAPQPVEKPRIDVWQFAEAMGL